MEDNKFQCSTLYEGKLVHWQLINAQQSIGQRRE